MLKNKTYKEFAAFLESKMGKAAEAKLSEIQPLSNFDPEIAEILMSFYDNKDNVIKRLGSVFNSIYTQQNNVFLLSKRISDDLCEADENHDIDSCNTESYKDMMNRALSNGLFTVLRKPVRQSSGVKRRAGLYELVHPKFLAPLTKSIGVDVCNAKKENFIKWWDEDTMKEAEVKPLPPKTEKELDIERRLRERKANRK